MARQSVSMSPSEWRIFLEEERTGVLASTGTTQVPFPHLVAMWYLPEDDGLVMWAYTKSQKVMNVRRDTHVAFLVEAGSRYDELRGVLIQGEAEIVDAYDEALRTGTALHRRYADPADNAETAARSIRAQAAKRSVIRIPYTRVVTWDHRKLRSD
jgi:nitroimidazol reductase NimA-like FMN-containing flavoprotein (pyridoxamine 5'-phosphate oxidase superfamily)